MSEGTKRDDGGPAFGGEYDDVFVDQTGSQKPFTLARRVKGMTLRDYFAAKVLAGVFSGGSHVQVAKAIADDVNAFAMTSTEIGKAAEVRIAAMSYSMADAMLAERAK